MPPTAESFAEAQKHHLAQRFAEAEKLYRQVIDTDPNHLGAWHHLGLVCLAQNKLDEAADGFQCVLALSPDNVEALTQLGIALARKKVLPEAVAKFRRAIELKPRNAKAYNNLGVALTELGQRDEALACYREAVALQPDYAEAHFNLGVAFTDRRQIAEAIAAYEGALRARPEYPEALFNLGMLLVEERRVEEAVVCLEQGARLTPNNPEAHNNLGLALADAGRFEQALASCDTALRLRPCDAKGHMNRGNVLAALGCVDAALANYDFALRLQPDYVNARWNKSLAHLSIADFERGWAEYESRWQKPETKKRVLPQPRWDGAPLVDKTILLWCEQGIGDTLQFVRYAYELKKLGARVWLECPESLVPLLATCRHLDRVLPEGKPPPPEVDCHAPLMSLPYLCGTKFANVPADTPYLFADPAEVEHWRKQLGTSAKLKIGMTWQGNPKHRYDRHRSFSVHWFRALALLEGVEVYSLQKGLGTEQLATVRFPFNDLRRALDERGGNFHHTAAAIEALDLVVTCDSAVAHLAGALGAPVWVAMSALSDWRWLRDRDDSPWYPTMRLFRQRTLGDWRGVFERIRDEVKNLRDAPVRYARVRAGDALGPLDNSRINAVKLRGQGFRQDAGLAGAADAARSQKIVDWPALLEMRAQARLAGKTVAWTNGCFDLLHVGHIRNLQAARTRGDLLVVGVNSDDSVRRIKGDGRPIVCATERAEVLAAMSCVDYVIVFDEDTPIEAIARLEPDVHCKGADYAPPNGKPIPEAQVIEAYGGRIEYLPMIPGVSTTDLVSRIQAEPKDDTPAD